MTGKAWNTIAADSDAGLYVSHDQMSPAELQRKMRNVVTVVRSIARRTAETSDNLETCALKLDGRLSAYARTLALLGSASAATVSLDYLIAEEFLACCIDEEKRLTLTGPRIELGAKPAETLGLAIHELVANAIEFGALSEPAGKVSVRWSAVLRGGADCVCIEWREMDGPALGVAPPKRGFGLQTLEDSIVFDLQGETDLKFGKRGLFYTIWLPLWGNDVRVYAETEDASPS